MIIRSLQQCFDGGSLNIDVYVSYKKREREEEENIRYELYFNSLKRNNATCFELFPKNKKRRVRRTRKRHPLLLLLDDGTER